MEKREAGKKKQRKKCVVLNRQKIGRRNETLRGIAVGGKERVWNEVTRGSFALDL